MIKALSASIETLRTRIDERHLRERLLLLAAVVVVLFLVWDVAVQTPLAERQERAEARIGELESNKETLRATEASLEQQLAEFEDAEDEDEITALEAEIADLETELAERTARVIGPDRMVALLRDMVGADAGLRLEALENTGVEEIIAADADEGIPPVYRHTVEVVTRGDFFALLGYLQRLESLDWELQWDALRIETEEHPHARATITLSTLSLDEEWIGV